MLPQHLFSPDVKEMIAIARSIALDLGYNYVSTVHFFLADCKLGRYGSIKDFAFKDDADYSKFYEGHRTGKAIINNNDFLPITKEAEQVICRSALESFLFSEKVICPHHFFMAAANVKDSVFNEIYPKKTDIYFRVINYYTDLGLINPLMKKGRLRMKIQKIIFSFSNRG